MARTIEDMCVGPCPQGCINCGRKHTVIYTCDSCGDEFDPDDLYDDDGDMLCGPCILENHYAHIRREYED